MSGAADANNGGAADAATSGAADATTSGAARATRTIEEIMEALLAATPEPVAPWEPAELLALAGRAAELRAPLVAELAARAGELGAGSLAGARPAQLAARLAEREGRWQSALLWARAEVGRRLVAARRLRHP
jgi:hypothetical protein